MEKIDGVVDIQTDSTALECSFRLTDEEVDYAAQLEEFAKTNTHLAGYTIQ